MKRTYQKMLQVPSYTLHKKRPKRILKSWNMERGTWNFTETNYMKRILIILIVTSMLIPAPVFAQIVGFDGGVVGDGYRDEYDYKEIAFITGKPIEVTGKVKIQEREKQDIVTTTYTYELRNDSEDIEVKRRLTYETNLYKKLDKNQTVGETKIDRFSERITVGNDRYNLEDYQFSRSIVYDNRPAVDFFSGNLTGKKEYSVNRDEGTIIIESSADDIVGYEHYWGATETYVINQDISFEKINRYYDDNGQLQDDTIKWEGLVKLKMSSVDKKSLSYISNKPTNISFRGGLLQTQKQENVMQYTYDLPEFDEDGDIIRRDRNRDEKNIRMETVPVHKRLVIPNIKDIGGHWAEESIFTLYSLEVFDDESSYFGPRLPMTRSEFAKAIVRAISILEEEEEAEAQRRQRIKEEEEEEIFEDVKKEDDKFKYIKFVKEKGIMEGVSESAFAPNQVLTRGQAITILIRTLGLQDIAPNPPYKTAFVDDNIIPYWAKDAIYVANAVGLVKGDPYGRVNPLDHMSRAEAAAFIHRFIKHIKDDITIDYREKIINNY